jgi:hypothetical protein
MWNLLAHYFAPLNVRYCNYFLLITMIFFILMLIALAGNLVWLIKNYKQLNFRIFAGAVIMLFNLFIAYFVNRLLYTMCVKSFN